MKCFVCCNTAFNGHIAIHKMNIKFVCDKCAEQFKDHFKLIRRVEELKPTVDEVKDG